jgi:hypothetical protein
MFTTSLRAWSFHWPVIVVCLLAVAVILADSRGRDWRSASRIAFRVAEVAVAFGFLWTRHWFYSQLPYDIVGLLVLAHAVTPVFWRTATS